MEITVECRIFCQEASKRNHNPEVTTFCKQINTIEPENQISISLGQDVTLDMTSNLWSLHFSADD